ncbi:hypothetical protein HYT23_06045 [Candidatus Pacearchaeota archaeon]|nr:hypothetical protein [Candidatus Pacearchaeota archaeon]
MRIQSKNRGELMNLIYNILNQGDSRYNAPEDEEILTDFLMNEAVFLKQKDLITLEYFLKEDFMVLFQMF